VRGYSFWSKKRASIAESQIKGIPSKAMKHTLPITILLLLSLSLVSTAMAAPVDVPSDAWFSGTVNNFVEAGYFDSQKAFRPDQKATRGEFVELVVQLLGGTTHAPFAGQSFDDVSTDHPLYAYFEEAGLQGWMKGSGSCYGSHPCLAHPNNPINRAEAAALLIRAFSLQAAADAPSFDDNPSGNWFTEHIKAAASLCILKGDTGSPKVRPADNMNRAEMTAMAERVLMKLQYPDCSTFGNATIPTAPSAKSDNKQTYTQCTKSAWKCVPSWCSTGGDPVEGTCALIDRFCLNSENVKPELPLADCSLKQQSSSQGSSSIPQTTLSCMRQPISCLEANLAFWTEERKKLTAKMENMSHQTSNSCMSTLALIEQDYVHRYNAYVEVINNFTNGGDWTNTIMQTEIAMKDVLKRIDAAPTYCY